MFLQDPSLFDTVICCGGHTAGREHPSEAQFIANSLRTNAAILIEDGSIDTPDNFINVRPLIKEINPAEISILSHAFHLPRALLLAERFLGGDGHSRVISGIAADFVLEFRRTGVWPTLSELLRRYTLNSMLEAALFPMAFVDPNGRIPRLITRNRDR